MEIMLLVKFPALIVTLLVFAFPALISAQDRRGGNFLGNYPAGTRVVYKPVDPAAHAVLAARLRDIPPAQR